MFSEFLDGLDKASTLNGQTMFKEYIKTLKTLATEGAEALYTGSLVNDIVNATGGMITPQDLKNYTVVEESVIR